MENLNDSVYSYRKNPANCTREKLSYRNFPTRSHGNGLTSLSLKLSISFSTLN